MKLDFEQLLDMGQELSRKINEALEKNPDNKELQEARRFLDERLDILSSLIID